MDAYRQLHALFVEDSEVDVELIVMELNRNGFDVRWDRVEVEDELRQALSGELPDIILSDYSMPSFSGVDALKIVREIDQDVPFIFVSGTIGEDWAIESIRQGATDYVLKDNLRRLGTAVRRALAETDERRRTTALEESRTRLADILEATSDFVAIFDPDLRITYLNASGRRLLGLAEMASVTNTSLNNYLSDGSLKKLRDEAWKAVSEKGIWEGETALLGKTGKEIPVSQVVIGHRDSNNNLRFLSTIARDIRDRKAFEEQIRYLANYDGLTDLPNRTLLRDRILQAIVYARRNNRNISLLIADIDHFKLVNDGFGHEAGDVLLREIAQRLSSNVRDGDTVARLGADGFAILAVDMNRPDDVLGIARNLQACLSEPYLINGQEIHMTASIGASIFPRDGEDSESLLRNAEAAMHRAKIHGRDGFEYYISDMTREAEDRMEVENALRHALTNNGLQLHYQPQIDLQTGKVIGAEALMRWQRDGIGWVAPAQFIPIAEETDLILGLDTFALQTACRQLQEWMSRDDKLGVRIAVNVSARQFHSKGFVNEVGRILRETAVDPTLLELEITESMLVVDMDVGMETIKRLKELGIRISVDDFGTGYSSLSYLSRLPIDCLKIDQSFVQRLSIDSYNVHIIQAIISLAHSLDMNVIAEGIETEEQFEFLRTHGCDKGQGYIISRPISVEAIQEIIFNKDKPIK